MEYWFYNPLNAVIRSVLACLPIRTTSFSGFSVCLFSYLGQSVRLIFPILPAFSVACAPISTWVGNLYNWFLRFYMLFQERVLLFLPGSATCPTDFSDFTCFSRSVCSFFYLDRQLVRPIFSNFTLFCYGFSSFGWGWLFSWIFKTIYFSSCISWINKVKGCGEGSEVKFRGWGSF